MNAAIRAFRPGDLPVLTELSLALYREDPSPEGMSAAKVMETARALAEHPDRGFICLFEDDGAALGYAIVILFWSNEYGGDLAVIDELYIRPAHRGRGLGGEFIEHLARSGRFRGLLLEVTPRNEAAQRFYARHGFAPARNRHLFRKV